LVCRELIVALPGLIDDPPLPSQRFIYADLGEESYQEDFPLGEINKKLKTLAMSIEALREHLQLAAGDANLICGLLPGNKCEASDKDSHRAPYGTAHATSQSGREQKGTESAARGAVARPGL
jgi:hypothetical protein